MGSFGAGATWSHHLSALLPADVEKHLDVLVKKHFHMINNLQSQLTQESE
jgi:hypothetical protein